MIRHLLTFMLASIFLFFSTTSFAMSFWPFSGFKIVDPCLNQGNTNWLGEGKSTGTMKCNYSGEGVVLGNAPNYQFKVHLAKTKGDLLCPGTQELLLNTTCIDGKITVRQNNIKLDGQLVDNVITMEGSISIVGIKNHVVLIAKRT